jgi:molybdopterin/thiamine biosynthesis adenylyltransferase
VSGVAGNGNGCTAIILDPNVVLDRDRLAELRADQRIEVVDRCSEQATTLQRLRPAPEPDLLAEPRRWAYYPWRRTVVSILGPRAFQRVRLDRNRHLITTAEQRALGALRIGVAGLSVGHAVAYSLAAQGLCGQLRLADFDELELSNLNRVPATVFDLGVNKATAAARRIAELDPYLDVRVCTAGLTRDNIAEFLDGLDMVVEECDSLDVKALVREEARARRLPVLMATSDRGLVDVERFDLEPDRPIFHGLLGDVDTAGLSGLTARQKIPHVLRIVDAERLSARGAASLLEVGSTLSTWPQLAADVSVGASAIAEAVRRIGLAEELSSGRTRVDLSATLDRIDDPTQHHADRGHSDLASEEVADEPSDVIGAVTAAAIRAPSGGNAQPWHIETTPAGLVIELAPERKSTMDVGFRGSAVAVGAAVFNARVAAAANGFHAEVQYTVSDTTPLLATVRLVDGADPDLAALYPGMLRRETNRHHGAATRLATDTVEALRTAAERQGARLKVFVDRDDIDAAANIFAATDRIRYLTPELHAEMVSELRWPGDAVESGIDVRSLELDSGELAMLDILRRPEVMATLADWDAGKVLGDDTRDRMRASAALAVVSMQGRDLVDYARGGSALEAVWITAQHRGLAVQPVSPAFLYAHGDNELRELSPLFARQLCQLRSKFLAQTGIPADESPVLLLRLSIAPPTSVRSRRRTVDRPGGPLL